MAKVTAAVTTAMRTAIDAMWSFTIVCKCVTSSDGMTRYQCPRIMAVQAPPPLVDCRAHGDSRGSRDHPADGGQRAADAAGDDGLRGGAAAAAATPTTATSASQGRRSAAAT